MRALAVTALGVLATLAAAGTAEGSTLVYVCGKDLCTSDDRGRDRERLTRDGARVGGYTRPTIDRAGRRVAFKVGDPGRVFTADARLRRRTRIAPAPDGARDATQFDAAISPDGRRVAWVETRINVVFGGSDFRRYVASVRGQSPRQVAANGGRPFVSWFDASTIVREGPPADVPPLAPDQSLCLPDPATATNGVCGRVIARDPARHLRHPSVSANGRLVVATAYAPPGGDDLSIDHAGAIVVFDAATGAIRRQLTAGPNDRGPVFSPDGRSVAFERRGGIWRVAVAGGRATRVIRSGRQPAWGR
jgi:dipeptidyl aminopeptidase/acylaminoacyl peptidase